MLLNYKTPGQPQLQKKIKKIISKKKFKFLMSSSPPALPRLAHLALWDQAFSDAVSALSYSAPPPSNNPSSSSKNFPSSHGRCQNGNKDHPDATSCQDDSHAVEGANFNNKRRLADALHKSQNGNVGNYDLHPLQHQRQHSSQQQSHPSSHRNADGQRLDVASLKSTKSLFRPII